VPSGGDVDGGRGCVFLGAGSVGEISVSSAPYCCKPKKLL